MAAPGLTTHSSDWLPGLYHSTEPSYFGPSDEARCGHCVSMRLACRQAMCPDSDSRSALAMLSMNRVRAPSSPAYPDRDVAAGRSRGDDDLRPHFQDDPGYFQHLRQQRQLMLAIGVREPIKLVSLDIRC